MAEDQEKGFVIESGFRRLVMLVLLVACVGNTVAEERTPPPGDGPVPVTVLVYLLDVSSIDSARQAFTANVYLEYGWTDSRLQHDGNGSVVRGLQEIWQPQLQILNQQNLISTFADNLEVFPDGSVRYRQRVWGDFSQPMNLRDYPHDDQQITIHLIAAGLDSDEIELVPASDVEHAFSENLSVADFEITGSEQVAEIYQSIGSRRAAESIRSTFFASRKFGYFLANVILPLVLIVMISWSVFWIDPSQVNVQMSVSTTTMLTLIAFRSAVGAGLPKISYLTRLDAFITVSTVLVALSLFEVVLTSRLASTGRLERAVQIDRWARLVFPSAFVLVACLTLLV